MSAAPDPTPTEAERAAVAAIAGALDVLTGGCGGEGIKDLSRRLRGLERVTRMVEAHVVVVVGEADRTGVFADDGHVSARNWAAAETNTSTAEALARSRTATLTRACPQVAAELQAGRVGVAQVRELARARSNPRIGTCLDDVIDEMLVEASEAPMHGFVNTVRAWESLVDADGAHRDRDDAHRGRRVRTRPDEFGGGELWGYFGGSQFAELNEILDVYTDAEFEADWEDARGRAGDDVSSADLTRTHDQRRADALLQALRDAAASKAPSADAMPTVNYVIPADVFDEQLAALIEGRQPQFDTTSLRWRLCQTVNGVPVDPAEVVAAALVGRIRRVVIDGEGRIIDFGYRRRIFTGAAREAALLQAVLDATGGRCLWPGCLRRRRCQVDHCTEWQDDGPTDLANAAWMCGRHNTFKSRGYTTWRDAHGHWHIYRPDGTEIAPNAA